MADYPLFLNIAGRPAVVVGGGGVAARKAASLLSAGAKVRLIAPELCPEAAGLKGPGFRHVCREYEPGDLEGALLAFAATDDPEVNRRVAMDASSMGVLINVADAPEACSFTVPASISRGGLTIAVSTGGASPAVAGHIRRRLERDFGPAWEPYLVLMKKVREKLIALGGRSEDRGQKLRRLVDSSLFDHLEQGDFASAEAVLIRVMGPEFSFSGLGFEPTTEPISPEKEV